MRLYKYAGISLMPQAVHPSVVKSAVNASVRQRRVWLQSKGPPKRNDREDTKKTDEKGTKNANAIPHECYQSNALAQAVSERFQSFHPFPGLSSFFSFSFAFPSACATWAGVGTLTFAAAAAKLLSSSALS